ncbi:hypothetical protein MMC19_005752 [Ptychographa xylographoides]|nr:hypothetical protein [Ptychographa xylographoides]
MEGALEDGVANQELNKFAGDAGIPSGADGVIDKEADQFIGGNASTGGTSGLANTAEDGMVNQGQSEVSLELERKTAS